MQQRILKHALAVAFTTALVPAFAQTSYSSTTVEQTQADPSASSSATVETPSTTTTSVTKVKKTKPAHVADNTLVVPSESKTTTKVKKQKKVETPDGDVKAEKEVTHETTSSTQ
jgi:hypothetical protein